LTIHPQLGNVTNRHRRTGEADVELGIDLGGTAIKLGVADGGAIVDTTVLPVTGSRSDLAEAAAHATTLLGDADKYGHLNGVDLVAWSEEAFGVPATVENDARAALIGEMHGGCADGARDAVAVILGTGIGTAAVMDGVLVRGAHGHAGVLGGHVTIDIHAPTCPCGNIGCAESLASTRALREQFPQLHGFDELLAGARESAVLAEAVERHLAIWGAVVVAMCHAYDPDVVVLSGGILRAGEAVRAPVAAYVHEHLWSSAHRPRISVPAQPEFSVVRGLTVLAARARHPRTEQKENR
jgi:glucokinase